MLGLRPWSSGGRVSTKYVVVYERDTDRWWVAREADDLASADYATVCEASDASSATTIARSLTKARAGDGVPRPSP